MEFLMAPGSEAGKEHLLAQGGDRSKNHRAKLAPFNGIRLIG